MSVSFKGEHVQKILEKIHSTSMTLTPQISQKLLGLLKKSHQLHGNSQVSSSISIPKNYPTKLKFRQRWAKLDTFPLLQPLPRNQNVPYKSADDGHQEVKRSALSGDWQGRSTLANKNSKGKTGRFGYPVFLYTLPKTNSLPLKMDG